MLSAVRVFQKYSNIAMSTLTKNKINLNGIIIAIPTPFQENEEQSVDYEKLKKNLQKWEKIPLIGYCIGGSYGEWPYLKDEEKLKMITIVKSLVGPSKLIVAGTTCESTGRTNELSQAAAQVGADMLMVQTPHYFRTQTTDKAIIEHFTSVADSSPIPVLIYNNPFTTGLDLSLNCIETLADHPNICGIKDIDVYKIGLIVEKTKNKDFSVLAAAAGTILPAMLLGCTGSMNGLAVILGDTVCEMFALARANEWNRASVIQKKLLMPDTAILRAYGPPGLKAAMDVLEYYGGVCRRPLLPLDEDVKIKIRDILKASGFAS